MQRPYFAQDRDQFLFMSKQSNMQAVDALAAIWSQRHNGTETVRRDRPLTQEDIAMDLQPQQYSDQLDYVDKLNNPRSWLHTICFQVIYTEQSKKEMDAILNLYMALEEKYQTKYRQRLLDAGYSEDKVLAVPLMPSLKTTIEYLDE